MSAGKFAGSGSCKNSVMVWFPLWKGERSLLNVGGEETSFWCVPGSVTWTTLTWHSTPTGCNNHTKKHRQELRCSKKPPTLSYSDFTSKFNSILQHQAGSDKCIVPCTGFMEYFLETSGSGWVGGGGCGCAHLGVHNHRLFTNHRETLPRKQTATLSFFPSLPPPQLGHLKLIECENYFFIF